MSVQVLGVDYSASGESRAADRHQEAARCVTSRTFSKPPWCWWLLIWSVGGSNKVDRHLLWRHLNSVKSVVVQFQRVSESQQQQQQQRSPAGPDMSDPRPGSTLRGLNPPPDPSTPPPSSSHPPITPPLPAPHLLIGELIDTCGSIRCVGLRRVRGGPGAPGGPPPLHAEWVWTRKTAARRAVNYKRSDFLRRNWSVSQSESSSWDSTSQ